MPSDREASGGRYFLLGEAAFLPEGNQADRRQN